MFRTADIIVCLIIAALVILVVTYLIRQRKSGHKSCGGDCSTCMSCNNCSILEAEKLAKKKHAGAVR